MSKYWLENEDEERDCRTVDPDWVPEAPGEPLCCPFCYYSLEDYIGYQGCHGQCPGMQYWLKKTQMSVDDIVEKADEEPEFFRPEETK